MPLTLEQLKARMAGIGGSDAAAVLGLRSARCTALEVYRSKVQEPVPEEAPDGPRVWGNLLEDAIAKHYAKQHDLMLFTPGTMVRAGMPAVATVDRIVDMGSRPLDPERALEIKTSDRSLAWRWGPSGGDHLPEEYWVQVQHYYAVIPTLVRIDVACLIGGNDYREYKVSKDESFCRDLLEAERAWWERHVIPRFPPDATEADLPTLKKLYPGTDGSTIELPVAAQAWHAVREDAMAQIRDLNTVSDVAMANILRAMGNAAIGLLPGGVRYERKLIKKKAYSVGDVEYMDTRSIKGRARQ